MNASLVLFGPTASGKSSLAMELARRNRGEILNMDSMQIYKGMDLGTAKPTEKDREEIPHHLFDLVEPHEDFSVAQYKKLALETIQQVKSRGNHPIFVGGTGLYLSALYYDYSFRPRNDRLRQELIELYQEKGIEPLQQMAKELYPIAYQKVDGHNPHRLLRFLESAGEEGQRKPSKLALCLVILDMDPSILHLRIQERVEDMVHHGLLEEVKRIYTHYGEQEYLPALKGIGYKEFYPYFRGECSLEEAVQEQIVHTRQYAKRQRTWGRNQYPLAHHVDALLPLEEKCKLIEEIWRQS